MNESSMTQRDELLQQIINDVALLDPPAERLGLLCSIAGIQTQMGMDSQAIVAQATDIAESLEGSLREDWLRMIKEAQVQHAPEPRPTDEQTNEVPSNVTSDKVFPADVLLQQLRTQLQEGNIEEARRAVQEIIGLVEKGEREWVYQHVIAALVNAKFFNDAIALMKRIKHPKSRLYAGLQILKALGRNF